MDYVVLITEVSVITSLLIEAIKNFVEIKKIELFSLITTVIIATFVYVVKGNNDIVNGIIFVFFCACGSQVGYDKVIKVIRGLFTTSVGTVGSVGSKSNETKN